LVLDAGAFIAIDRNDRAMAARLRAAERHGLALRTSAMVVAQVWRDPAGRQAALVRLLQAVAVRPIDQALAREAGVLLARSGTSDAIDATVMLVADDGDRVLTSDPKVLTCLAASASKRVVI